MKKIGKTLLSAAFLTLALAVGGCSLSDERLSSDIKIDPNSNVSSDNSSDESSESPESSESEIFVNEEITAVIEKIAVSEKNVFVSSAPEFVVDDENVVISLDVDYTNYIDKWTLENLLLDIEVSGGTFELDGDVSADGGIDITKDAYLIVTDDGGKRKRFELTANRTVHDLPIMNIRLEEIEDVSSIQYDVYTKMEMYFDCSGAEEFSDTRVLAGNIRGRGHSTWKLDKKPYRIRLVDSVPLLGMPKNRDWILIANHDDKSFMRNIVAYDMGRELSFIWTGTQYPVDLFVNGEYQGVYAFGEHREISQHRINIDDSDDIDRGFVLEIGGADDKSLVNGVDYFHTNSNSVRFITFADPQAYKLTAEQRQFLMDYVNAADAAIVSGEGYEEYIDVQSFCDWIIIHELACNLDSCFRRSCYITKDKGSKLMMGPLWDFDLAFGNFDMDNTAYNTWFTIGTTGSDPYIRVNWCNYLMNDPEFRAQLKARWFEVRDRLLERAIESIDRNKAKIDASQEENYAIWDIWGRKIGLESWATANITTYDGQVEYIKSFLTKRAKWIDENI